MIKDLLFVLISSVASLVVLFALTKLMGQKQVSQLSLFDYTIGISIGSIAAEMATDIENPEKSLFAMIIYGFSAFLINIITSKSIKARRLISGAPVVLMRGEIIYRKNLKRSRIDVNDLLMASRAKGYFNLADVELALLEHNGTISFLPKETKRPVSPEDLSINPDQQNLGYEVIMDGKIMYDNLKKSGRDERWLEAELKRQKILNVSDVFVGIFDNKNSLSVWKCKKQ